MNRSAKMPEPQDTLPGPQVYLTQRDLCLRWQLSGRTLKRWRAEGVGPAWYVIGGSIRYRVEDVEDYELRQRHDAISARETDRSKGELQ